MNCTPEQTFLESIKFYQATADRDAAQKIVTQSQQPSLQQGGMQEFVLPNLASIGVSGNVDQLRNESSGDWLYFAKSGSNPNAEFSIEFTGGRTFTKVVPGTMVRGSFQGFLLTRTGENTGTARFIIGQTLGFEYNENAIADTLGLNNLQYSLATGSSPSSAAYNAAAFGAGAPTNQTGLSVQGANAVRAYLVSNNGIITAGSVRWWVRDVAANAFANGIVASPASTWWPSPTTEDLVTGSIRCVTSDFQIGLKTGFVFPEFIGLQNLGGGPVIGWFTECL